MPLTKAEIRDRAGEELGIKRIGQAMANESQVRIEQGYDEVYADLKTEGIVPWASTASVPNEYVPHIANLVALNCMGVFGISNARVQRIIARAGITGELAKREIRKLMQPPYESAEDPTDY